MTKIKICGLMRMEDIDCVNRWRPEYVGFVFANTRRKVSEGLARQMREALDPDIKAVGVFVNEAAERVAYLANAGIIDLAQLHGEENEAYIEKLRGMAGCPIIKAARVRESEDILRAQRLSCDYLLLDTYVKSQYGGTGHDFDLTMVPELAKPFFLAGGLTAENVREKIRAVQPFAVDISSGVEGEDGQKDQERIRRFIEQVREERD